MVIETGVAAGVSTNAMLSALQINGAGNLLSLDITLKVGELVDDKLKTRWKLEILPELARENSFAKYLKENNEATIFFTTQITQGHGKLRNSIMWSATYQVSN